MVIAHALCRAPTELRLTDGRAPLQEWVLLPETEMRSNQNRVATMETNRLL